MKGEEVDKIAQLDKKTLKKKQKAHRIQRSVHTLCSKSPEYHYDSVHKLIDRYNVMQTLNHVEEQTCCQVGVYWTSALFCTIFNFY